MDDINELARLLNVDPKTLAAAMAEPVREPTREELRSFHADMAAGLGGEMLPLSDADIDGLALQCGVL